MRDRALIPCTAIAAAAGALLVLGIVKLPGAVFPDAVATPVPPPPLPRPAVNGAMALQQSFAETAERSMAGVVLVTAQKRVGVVSPADYYRRRVEYREVPSGQGSGFFIREDGYILTNFHVVRDQDSFWVTTNDGSEYRAKVVGIDPPSDLALLKVDSDRKFPKLEFADIDKVRIGHWVIAIGAPFSLSRSVTAGIVSGKQRSGVGVNLHESYIQTDASINPGNSGGPLLNLAGEVIGVNDFILSPSGGNIGISFAISADLARRVADELIANGWVRRPWLGVILEVLDRETRTRLKLEHGVAVTQLYRDSPAASALERGDVILEIDGNAVALPADLQGRIFSAPPESKVRLKLWRSGEILEREIQLESAPRSWFSREFGRMDGASACGA